MKNNNNNNGKNLIYLACCGPTFPGSWALLAVIWKSFIVPVSIPSGALQWANQVKSKQQQQENCI